MIIGLLLDRCCIEIFYCTCVKVTVFHPQLQFQCYARMYKMLDNLVTRRLSPKENELPSPNQLKNKIIIKHKKKGEGENIPEDG